MPSPARPAAAAALSIVALTCLARAQTVTEPRRWDQEQAVAKVEGVLAVEQQGRPWDRIAWQTDPAKAANEARAHGKPLLLYFFLRKHVGPEDAPC